MSKLGTNVFENYHTLLCQGITLKDWEKVLIFMSKENRLAKLAPRVDIIFQIFFASILFVRKWENTYWQPAILTDI